MPSSRFMLEVPADLVSDKTIPPKAKSLYLTIRLYNPCSVNELAAASGISRESIRELLGSLVQAGWVVVRGRSNRKEIIPTAPERTQDAMALRLKENRSLMAYVGQCLMTLLLDVTVDSDDFVDNARPWFLQNPTTGEFLEYDRYYKVGVAFEFNGAQHYGTTELFPDEAKVIETQKRDEVKARLSRIRRVLLVYVSEDDLTVDGMLAKIPDTLPRAAIIRDSPYIRALQDMCGQYVANCKRMRTRERARNQRRENERSEG